MDRFQRKHMKTSAQAMNQLGGKSNSGEGGEDAKRYGVS
ncbi:glutamate synthase-related protein [Staphylococcus aureus]